MEGFPARGTRQGPPLPARSRWNLPPGTLHGATQRPPTEIAADKHSLFSSGPGRLHVLGRSSQWLLLRTWVVLFCCCCGNRNKASSYQLCKARFNPAAAESFVMALPSVLDTDGAPRPRASPQPKQSWGRRRVRQRRRPPTLKPSSFFPFLSHSAHACAQG